MFKWLYRIKAFLDPPPPKARHVEYRSVELSNRSPSTRHSRALKLALALSLIVSLKR